MTRFGPCQPFYLPPELERYTESPLLVYAVKLHPALADGSGWVPASYLVNSCRLSDLQEKCDLYYPRFLRLRPAE